MHKTCSDLPIVGLLIDSRVGAVVIAIEAVLERERVSHFEIFPDNNSSGPELTRVYDEAARWQTDEL